MSIDIKDNLFNSGAALVLQGERELLDTDLAQLRDLSEKQRAAITSVVLSNTNITGECFRYLAFLPNLRALYANKTRVNDDAPLECLPKSMEIINLDDTATGDVSISKLKMAPRLYSIHLRKTGVTNRGGNILAAMPNLRECHVDGMVINEHTRQRLNNAMVLRVATFNTVIYAFLYCIQLEVRKFVFRARGVGYAWHHRGTFSSKTVNMLFL